MCKAYFSQIQTHHYKGQFSSSAVSSASGVLQSRGSNHCSLGVLVIFAVSGVLIKIKFLNNRFSKLKEKLESKEKPTFFQYPRPPNVMNSSAQPRDPHHGGLGGPDNKNKMLNSTKKTYFFPLKPTYVRNSSAVSPASGFSSMGLGGPSKL